MHQKRNWKSKGAWIRGSVVAAAFVAAGTAATLHWDGEKAGSSTAAPSETASLPWPSFAPAHARGQEAPSLASIAEAATQSVVSVSSTMTRPAASGFSGAPWDNPGVRRWPGERAPEERQGRGLGSGVIVSADGTVLTNSHVVDHASEILVTLPDGREFKAEVRGADPKSDLAVLKLKGDFGKLKPIAMGDSKRLRLGDVVLAIGNPFGLGQTVTMGIVSATSRAGMGIVDYEDFIQTDAAINPGNSGGAMVNMEGKLVGINTAILSRSGGNQGIGFAIPTAMIQPIVKSILEHGKVVRGYLGVGIQDIDTDLQQALGLKDRQGVLISSVSADSPAASAGLERGDVVVEFAGQPVTGAPLFRNRVAAEPPGSNQKLVVVRNGQRKQLEVRLGTLPTHDEPSLPGTSAPDSSALGVEVMPLTNELRSRLQLPNEVRQGVVVAGVEPASPAAEAGLRQGDVIVEVNRQSVQSPSQLKERVSELKGVFSMLIARDGTTFYVTLKKN